MMRTIIIKMNKYKMLNIIYLSFLAVGTICLTIALGFTFGCAFAYALGFIK